ncbi:hypothetical protein D9M73_228850 [compost metagenome]
MNVQAAVIQAGNGNRRRCHGGFDDRRGRSWLQLRRGLVDLLHHRLSVFYGNFSEYFGIHRMFLGGLFLLS